MTAPKGKTPCLIGTTLGKPSFVHSGGRGSLRKCKRCHSSLDHGANCVEVTIPNSMAHKTYCLTCFGRVLDATQDKLNALREELAKFGTGASG